MLLAAEPAGDERRASSVAAATAAADAEALKDVEDEASDEDANVANEDEGDRVRPDARPCDKAAAEAEGSSENTSSLGESVAITMRWPLTMSADCKSGISKDTGLITGTIRYSGHKFRVRWRRWKPADKNFKIEQ